MPRLHPAVAATRTAVRDALRDLQPGERVLVGLSGGVDSLALAAATGFVAPRAGLGWGVVVVDHGLQPGSSEVAERAGEQARALGADPVRVAPVRVRGPGGPEAAARDARRVALSAAAREHGAAAVLLGHTLDDQAETVLLGLARGSGTRSLAGMRPRDGLWRRPLLATTRDTTRAACAELGLDWWEDPHNSDDTYARVRVRRHLMAALGDQLGPGVAAALARTADLARDDADLLDELATDLAARATGDDGQVDCAVLADAPRALRTRVLRTAAVAAGCPPTDLAAGHVHAVERLVLDWHGQAGVDLPGEVVATRTGRHLRLARRVAG